MTVPCCCEIAAAAMPGNQPDVLPNRSGGHRKGITHLVVEKGEIASLTAFGPPWQ